MATHTERIHITPRCVTGERVWGYRSGRRVLLQSGLRKTEGWLPDRHGMVLNGASVVIPSSGNLVGEPPHHTPLAPPRSALHGVGTRYSSRHPLVQVLLLNDADASHPVTSI